MAENKISDLLSEIGLTRMQEAKLEALVSQGGSFSAATVIVHMPSGEVASVDPFGRVNWITR